MSTGYLKRSVFLLSLALMLNGVKYSHAESNSVLLIDYAESSSQSIIGLERINNVPFKKFSTLLLEAIKTRFGSVQVRSVDLSDSWEDRIAIVRIPVVSNHMQPDLVQELSRYKPVGDCVVLSPWADLGVVYSPRPELRGVFYWNERQVLWDKMLLAGYDGSGPASKKNILRTDFDSLAREYSEFHIDRFRGVASNHELMHRTPADLLWLFKYSPQSTLAPFESGVEYTLHKLTEDAVSTYTELATWLLDRCKTSTSRKIQYRDVRSLGGFDVSPLK